ncbi:flagellar basal body L-ring protein FlgH [Pseudoduganella buxea]|uniref:Flagellar L-ring protein n=1 Tax=Pseudoduganella buxea TaxID=1949069 RepID=A0A6I3T7R7_9BURK|nr:flagellar basal body L-ring protein FlgH [Pseudoduganella buxea]MTV55627.1 flagellar biosynthesis protein FlgH [Pseudoduganella buxea]GGC23576.1 flagellar L-ring protein [Pseudoduganella buxea]
MKLAHFASVLVAATLAGCASTPTTIVAGPTSARPIPPLQNPVANGAIYQAASYRPAFEDRRARLVGDILNVNITERTSAVKNGASSNSRSGSANFGIPGPLQAKLGANIGTNSENKSADSASQTASNTFTGTMAVTVVEVLSNGNLVVAGEKQVAMDKGTEFIRVSGVVSPDTIGAGNTVPSTAIADARVEYRTNTHLDRAELTSMASRFFMSLLPF